MMKKMAAERVVSKGEGELEGAHSAQRSGLPQSTWSS